MEDGSNCTELFWVRREKTEERKERGETGNRKPARPPAVGPRGKMEAKDSHPDPPGDLGRGNPLDDFYSRTKSGKFLRFFEPVGTLDKT